MRVDIEKQKWLQAIKRTKRPVIFIIAFVLLLSIALRIFQLYNGDNFSFIDILGTVMLLAVYFFAKKRFVSYEETIAKLTESEMQEFRSRNSSVSKWRRIFPPFILTADAVRVFQGVIQPIYYFNQITEMHALTSYNRSGAVFAINFTTLQGKNMSFKVNTYDEQMYLVKHIATANPKVKVTLS